MPSLVSARARRLAALLPVAALVALAAPAAASATTYTATGVACTKVGTSGDDVLTGTAGRDVICGRGGDDVITGLGGDDVIDGGAGDDSISGGAGNDKLSGSAGNDTVSGGAGDDKVSGNDGADHLSGGPGADTEYGGAGNDAEVGGAGDDLILGQGGNDDLSGQAGSDSLNGGAGTNWCTVGSSDSEKACKYDRDAPTVDVASFTASATRVDVTKSDTTVKVRVRLKDDTGVVRASVGAGRASGRIYLVAGTVRDGIWEGTVLARRYSAPGKATFGIGAVDRVGRGGTGYADETLTISDATPDLAPPAVHGVTLSTTKLDVRKAAGELTITTRVTDDASGVRPDGIVGCLLAPGEGSAYVQVRCDNMTRVKGTARDGTWRVTSPVARGSVGGDWNVAIWVNDVLNYDGEQYYWGPDAFRYFMSVWPTGPDGQHDPRDHALAGARFAVLGATDNVAAKIVGLKTDKVSVDTLAGDAVVNLYVHATDVAGEGVSYAGAYVEPAEPDQLTPQGSDGELYQGTETNGWWRVAITFPQGLPPGRYLVSQLIVEDRTHWRSYTPPNSPYAGQDGQLALPASSVKTADNAAWDGVITVVANPAG